MKMNKYLYDKKTTLAIEKSLSKENISSLLLMMRAGYSIYSNVKKNIDYDEIVVLAGPGNNGGDAISFAIHAKINNEKIVCISLSKHKNDSEKLYKLSKEIGLKYNSFKKSLFSNSSKKLIIDGIFGIGISREPTYPYNNIIEYINNLNRKKNTIVSIDIPSGLNPDNGVAHSKTVFANHTIMCLTRKRGCYTGDGLKASGKLHFSNLGIKNLNKIKDSSCILLNTEFSKPVKRDKFGHKGSFGNVFILGGWDNMPGAANLASLAALKAGCGKVFICTNNCEKLPDEVIRVSPNKKKILDVLKNIDVIIAGPGLGNKGCDILKLFWNKNVPLILDADGISWLAKNFKKKRKAPLIGTPHYGEARRLLKQDFKDRFEAVNKIQKKYGGKWILKGAGTLIVNNKIYVNDFSNSILATAGSGDVLAGIIGGLVAQKIQEPELLGVQIHTLAAKQLLSKNYKTMIASDILNKISSILNFY